MLLIFIAIGAWLGGLIGFIIALLMTVVISSMFGRIEKEKVEKRRHEEMLQAIKSRNS
jgi:predicted PurR-regulated permease PerM